MDFSKRLKARMLSSSIVATVLGAAVGSVGVRAVASVLGLAVTVILIRVLGKSGLGVYAYVISVANLLVLLSVFGMDRVVIRKIAEGTASDNPGLTKGVVRMCSILAFLFAVVLSGSFVLLTLVWPDLFAPEYRVPLRVLALLAPLLALARMQQAAIRGFRWVVSSQVPQQLLRPAVMLAGLLVVLFLSWELEPVEGLLWQATAVLLALLLGTMVLFRARPPGIRSAKPVFETRKWLMISAPVMGVALANQGGIEIASIILGTVSEPSELSEFTASRQMARFMSFFIMAINLSIAPTIAHLYAAGRMDELKPLGTRTVRFALLLALPLGIAMLCFPRFFMSIYGEEFIGQTQTFRFLICTELANIILGSASIWLLYTGHERLALKGAICGLVTGVIANLLLAPGMGAMGTAIALFASLLVTKLVLWRYIHIRLGINPTAFGRT